MADVERTLHQSAGHPNGGQFIANPAPAQHTPITYGAISTGGHNKGGGGKGGSAAAAKAPAASSKFTTLAPGQQNDVQAMTEMQQLLTALGFKTPVTGKYDQATLDAVRQVQGRLGIKQDGKANRALVDKMLAAYDLSPCVNP